MGEVLQLNPGSVAIVAMGQSAGTYLRTCSTLGSRCKVADETWAINAMGGVIQHDLLFHMDDCKVQESRAESNPDGNIAGLMKWLKKHPRFFTSKSYDDYPGAIEYPLQDVINNVGVSYFNNTVSYAVAMAMHIGVKRISLYGVDFSYVNQAKAERGRACVEFLLGVASAQGIDIQMASDTTLMDACIDIDHKFYGYDASHVEIKETDNGVRVMTTPRETLPTADEIEARYNHGT